MKKCGMALFALILWTIPVHAGQLFPPTNVDSDQKCPAGTFLVWNGAGEVTCEKAIRPSDIPECADGESLKFSKEKFTCTDVAVPQGTLCGTAFWETRPASAGFCEGNNTMRCKGKEIMPSCGVIVCPVGYAPTATQYSWGDNGYTFIYNTGSCAKQ